MTLLETVADDLAVEPGDIEVVMRALGADEFTNEVAGEVRTILNPHCERTVPEFYGQTGEDA
jgi:hypothetical protein